MELLVGPILGKTVGELVDAVKAEEKKVSSFKSNLKSIESTLERITPHLEEITRLDEQLNHSSTAINDLVALVRDGRVLVDKCSQVTFFNKFRYSDKLVAFDKKLKRDINSVLQLDQAKGIKQILVNQQKTDSFLNEWWRRERIPVIDAETGEIELTPVIRAEIGEIEESVQLVHRELIPVIEPEILGESQIPEELVEETEDDTSSSSNPCQRKEEMEDEAEAEGSSSRDDQALGMAAYCDKPVMTRQERACAALSTMDAKNKKEIVLNFLDSHTLHEFGYAIFTKCMVYNATGDTVRRVDTHDWFGSIGEVYYPAEIENGQWGGFLHAKTYLAPSGSVGAVVYRGKNLKDEECDWMLSWSNPLFSFYFQKNCVYTEIREGGHYEKHYWGLLENKLNHSGKTHRDEWNGCSSSMTCGNGFTAVVEAILTLKNADIEKTEDGHNNLEEMLYYTI